LIIIHTTFLAITMFLRRLFLKDKLRKCVGIFLYKTRRVVALY
jgi:hypothetical protein